MMKIKRVICVLLAAAMLMPGTVFADGWVNVSAWAYNEVSNFTSEGLLPESFNGISEYRELITREQFAELVCSVLLHPSGEAVIQGYKPFEDTGNDAAATLFVKKIINGTSEEAKIVAHTDNEGREWETTEVKRWFSPNENITRQDAAVVIFNALNYANDDFRIVNSTADQNEQVNRFNDHADIADYARKQVYGLYTINMITGDDSYNFVPQGNMTIEQAVALCYRLYRNIPSASRKDGHEINGREEAQVQTYPNGLTETKKDDVLYVKNGSTVIKAFETDIYSRILSAGDYIAAQNFNHRTEIYSISTGELLFEIPLTVYQIDDQYIYTQSAYVGTMTFGLYDYSGHEILPAEYSLEEIEYLIGHDFQKPETEKTAADGWIYYADWNDKGHLYKIDTNGENKQKLSDHDCFAIRYYDGWVYYSIRGENNDENLYAVREDGKYEQRLSTEQVYFIKEEKRLKDSGNKAIGYYVDSNNQTYAHTEKGVYYAETIREPFYHQRLYLLQQDEHGNLIKTEVMEDLYKKQIRAFAQDDIQSSLLTFTSADTGDSPVTRGYAVIEGKAICVTGEYNVQMIYPDPKEKDVFRFSVVTDHYPKDTTIAYYRVNLDGSGCEKIESKIVPYTNVPGNKEPASGQEEPEQGKEITYLLDQEMNDEQFKLYEKYVKGNNDKRRWLYVEHNGEMKEVASVAYGYIQAERAGDILYYCFAYSDKNNHALYAYDMRSGSTKEIADNLYYNSMELYAEEGFILYRDNNNDIWRYSIKENKLAEVYPNKGFYRYTQPIAIRQNKENNYLYKIDKNGKFTDVVSAYAAYWIVVKNGSIIETNTNNLIE